MGAVRAAVVEVARDGCVGAAVAAVVAGPAIAAGQLVGAPNAETYGHAWVQACAAARWPAWPSGTDLALGAADRAVIDPLPTWLAGALAHPLGLTGAWNALVVVWIVLAAIGGGALARAAGLNPRFVALALALSPIWRGSLWSGLTEDGAIGLVALALAGLLAGRARWGPALAGGLATGLLAWCGLYLAWLGAASAVAIAFWAALRRRWAAVGRLAVAGVLALAVAAPAVRPFAARLSGAGHRYGAPPVAAEPLWRVNPWRAADAASFVAPGRQPVGDAFVREHPAWAGYPVLALAGVGAVSGGGALVAPVALLAAWSVGPSPSLAGQPLGWSNPVAVALDRLPLASSFNHHARLWLLGQLGLVVLAGYGVRRLGPWAAPLAMAAVVADAAWLAPGPLVLPGTPSAAPSIYAHLSELPAGPLAVVGASGPGIHPQKVFFDQRAHGRRLLANPDRPEPVDVARLPAGALVVALGDDAAARTAAVLGEPAARDASGAVWGPRGATPVPARTGGTTSTDR